MNLYYQKNGSPASIEAVLWVYRPVGHLLERSRVDYRRHYGKYSAERAVRARLSEYMQHIMLEGQDRVLRLGIAPWRLLVGHKTDHFFSYNGDLELGQLDDLIAFCQQQGVLVVRGIPWYVRSQGPSDFFEKGEPVLHR